MVTWDAPGPGYLGTRSIALRRGRDAAGPIHPGAMRCLQACAGCSLSLAFPPTRSIAAFVNGFMYTRLRPLIGADRPAKNLPPRFVLRAVGRFHPEFRRRTKAADRTRIERPWRKVVDDWEHGGRRAGRIAKPRHSESRSERARRSHPGRTCPGSPGALPCQLGAPLLVAWLRPRSDRVVPCRLPRLGRRTGRRDPSARGRFALDGWPDAHARQAAQGRRALRSRAPRSRRGSGHQCSTLPTTSTGT